MGIDSGFCDYQGLTVLLDGFVARAPPRQHDAEVVVCDG
jgi:hypothetical protein